MEQRTMTTRRFGYIRKLPSGRFQASYQGPDDNRHKAPTTFSNERIAKEYLKKQAALIELGQWENATSEKTVKSSSPLFGDYCARHVDIQTTSGGNLLRPSTKALYSRILRTHLSPFVEIHVKDIATSTVSEWWAAAISGGQRTMHAKAYKLLSSVMKRAVDEGLRDSNPCRVKGAQAATTGREIILPNHAEVELLIAAINPRYKHMVMISAHSALRFSEVTALTRSDLVPVIRAGKKAYEVKVSKGVTLVNGEFHVDKPKSKAGARSVKLPSFVTQEIDAYLNTMLDVSPTALVFPSATGGYLRHDVFTNSFKAALRRAGLDPKIALHGLRHYAGSEFGRTGANLAEIKEWMGDSSTAAVMRYIHPTDRTDELVESMRTAI
jgi:integrase